MLCTGRRIPRMEGRLSLYFIRETTMKCVIVPDSLSAEIYKRIDEKLALLPIPDDLAAERENMYQALLFHFDAHGVIPDFDIVPRTQSTSAAEPK